MDRSCKRCISGKLMHFGDEITCINCGWEPPVAVESFYRRVLKLQTDVSLAA